MAEFIAHNMAPIMFASLVVFLLLGYPVAFSLAAVGLVFFIVGVEVAPLSHGEITLSWPLLQSLPERIYGIMNNDVLLAIPFFTFMGLVLERSGMAEDLLDTIGQLFGTIRGGLAYAVVFVGALLAATTGVVAASVISMGLISLPIMLRYGYDRRVATRRDRGLRNAGADHPALARADRHGRPARPFGRRHVRRRVHSRRRAGGASTPATSSSSPRCTATAAPGLPPDAVGFREPDGNRGLTSLAILTVVSGLVGYFVDAHPALSRRRLRHPDHGGRHRLRLRRPPC